MKRRYKERKKTVGDEKARREKIYKKQKHDKNKNNKKR